MQRKVEHRRAAHCEQSGETIVYPDAVQQVDRADAKCTAGERNQPEADKDSSIWVRLKGPPYVEQVRTGRPDEQASSL